MMTTLAAMFGALPLALGRGVGAELRRPLGLAIVGGIVQPGPHFCIRRQSSISGSVAGALPRRAAP